MKKNYDLVFGLGPACSASQAIRKAGLQSLSFPFDWIGPTFGRPGWEHDLQRRTDLICSEFEDWLRPEDFTFLGPHTNRKDKYYNNRLELTFLHDFPVGSSFQGYFPALVEKYHRRCSRLLELIRRSKKILIVRVERPDLDYRTPLDDCRYARKRLSEHFAPAQFDVVLLQCDASLARGEIREEPIEDGILRISLDYRNLEPGADVMQPDHGLTSGVLRERFAVREYRTQEEIAAWKSRQRAKRYARYGASNFLQYRWRRLMAALGGNGTGNA